MWSGGLCCLGDLCVLGDLGGLSGLGGLCGDLVFPCLMGIDFESSSPGSYFQHSTCLNLKS